MGSIAGDDDVEQAVVVEVVHDRAAGLVEAIDPHQMADVAELADVELGVEEAVQVEPDTGDRPCRDIRPGSCGPG